MHVGVAVSGGLDSTALLHCVVGLARRHPALRVHALHVNHGLQTEADDWQRHVAEQCRRWSQPAAPVAFRAARLVGYPGASDSVEAWARKHRYAALARLADEQGCRVVLLAHHRNDQAETVLLQALRGAGPAGLAGMPTSASRDGIVWARPWLAQPRSAIEAYVRRFRLSHVDDPSNASPRFARNRLRHAVMPALQHAFPGAEVALEAVARRAHEAASVLVEVAAQDAQVCLDGDALRLAPWLALSEARRRNLLRAWLTRLLPSGAPESLVDRLAHEVAGKRVGRWPAGPGELRLHAGRLVWHRAEHDEPAAPPNGEAIVDLRRPGGHRIPGWSGEFRVERVTVGGIETTRLREVQIRSRAGGEQFQRGAGSPPRSLKKQFQALGVPTWGRDGPLVWAGAQLLFVAGLGVDARAVAVPGTAQRRLVWLPDAGGVEGKASGSAG